MVDTNATHHRLPLAVLPTSEVYKTLQHEHLDTYHTQYKLLA